MAIADYKYVKISMLVLFHITLLPKENSILHSESFIAQILKVVCPLGKELIFFSPLGFETQ